MLSPSGSNSKPSKNQYETGSKHNMLAACFMLIPCLVNSLTLKSRRYVPLKCQLTFSRQHDTVSQKMELFLYLCINFQKPAWWKHNQDCKIRNKSHTEIHKYIIKTARAHFQLKEHYVTLHHNVQHIYWHAPVLGLHLLWQLFLSHENQIFNFKYSKLKCKGTNKKSNITDFMPWSFNRTKLNVLFLFLYFCLIWFVSTLHPEEYMTLHTVGIAHWQMGLALAWVTSTQQVAGLTVNVLKLQVIRFHS
jgi:hypothetical protein